MSYLTFTLWRASVHDMALARARGCAGRGSPCGNHVRQADASRRRNGPRKATSRRPITVRLPAVSGQGVARPGNGVARPRTGELDDRDDPFDAAEPDSPMVPIQMEGDGPLVLREKVHAARPMTIDQALLEMELVGHDFFLFHDSECDRFSVVYRRRGYDYGVIRLVEE